MKEFGKCSLEGSPLGGHQTPCEVGERTDPAVIIRDMT